MDQLDVDRETTYEKPSGPSYEVTEEEVLEHTKVCKRLHDSVGQLEVKAKMLAKTFAESAERIPYGMRYI